MYIHQTRQHHEHSQTLCLHQRTQNRTCAGAHIRRRPGRLGSQHYPAGGHACGPAPSSRAADAGCRGSRDGSQLAVSCVGRACETTLDQAARWAGWAHAHGKCHGARRGGTGTCRTGLGIDTKRSGRAVRRRAVAGIDRGVEPPGTVCAGTRQVEWSSEVTVSRRARERATVSQ